MQNFKALLTFVSMLLCLPGSAHGQITPSADAYTSTANPTANYGSKTLLYVEGASQTAYIQFDLSSIPAGYTGADITKATLKLYVNAVGTAGSFNVDYVAGSWTESTLTSSLAPALGTTIAASVPLTTADKNQYVLIDITPAVQAWVNGNQANDGIALVGNARLLASFDSKENTATSHPPELDIVFAGGLTGVTTAGGSGLTGGGNSGTLNLSLINTCSANQVLEWNGTVWACATPPGVGANNPVFTGAVTVQSPTGGSISFAPSSTSNFMQFSGSLKVPNYDATNPSIGGTDVPGAGWIFYEDWVGYVLGPNTFFATLGNGSGWTLSHERPFGWSSALNNASAGPDTCIYRHAQGIVGVSSNCGTTPTDVSAALESTAYIAAGATFTSNAGCSETGLTGGATKGSFLAGAASCTLTVTMGNSASAPNGWVCSVWDLTTVADAMKQTAASTTTVTFSGTVVLGDKIIFGCDGF